MEGAERKDVWGVADCDSTGRLRKMQKNFAHGWTRTSNLPVNSRARCQLRHTSGCCYEIRDLLYTYTTSTYFLLLGSHLVISTRCKKGKKQAPVIDT